MYFDQKMTGRIWCSPVIGNVICHSRFSPVIMTGMTGLAQRPAVRIYIALEFFMKACTLTFMVVNGHHGGSLSTFLTFQKFISLDFRRQFLGQNLPQIQHFHKVGGDTRLVGSRKDFRLQMRSQVNF